MPSKKGKNLLGRTPEDLTDEDLDIQIGAAAEEKERLENEILTLDRVRIGLQTKLDVVNGLLGVARSNKGNRGNSGGNGNGRGNR